MAAILRPSPGDTHRCQQPQQHFHFIIIAIFTHVASHLTAASLAASQFLHSQRHTSVAVALQARQVMQALPLHLQTWMQASTVL
jgi:hypothetical protein